MNNFGNNGMYYFKHDSILIDTVQLGANERLNYLITESESNWKNNNNICNYTCLTPPNQSNFLFFGN